MLIPIIFLLMRLMNLQLVYSEPSTDDVDISRICIINTKYLHRNHPMLVNPQTNAVYYPESSENIVLEHNQAIDFHCPSANVRIMKSEVEKYVKGRCIGNNTYAVPHHSVQIHELECTALIQAVEIDTGIFCPPDGVIVKVGYELHDRTFIQQYLVCFNKQTHAVYTSFHVLKRGAKYGYGNLRSKIITSQLTNNIGESIHHFYEFKNQRTRFNVLAGFDPKSNSFVNHAAHLVKYSLVSKSNFLYKYEQRATIRYVNMIPIWSSLASNNWQAVDWFIRSYWRKKNVTLNIYSGSVGVMMVRHRTYSTFQRLYLFQNTTLEALPVPLQIWKVVYDPTNKAGIAYIGLNDPYNTKMFKVQICPDISSRFTGNYWPTTINVTNNYFNGYIYACEIKTFRQSIKTVPKLNVTSILEPVFE